MATTEDRTIDALAAKAGTVDLDALQGWHLARQRAKRYNRNLLQYGAGLAAVLGINAGTGGMLKLADSLEIRSARASGDAISEPARQVLWDLTSLAGWIVAITAVAAVLLLILLIAAFRERQRAERQADGYVPRLIATAPQWFRPGED